jgi:hypothetical protein
MASWSVRSNIRINIDATEVQGGGLLPPSAPRFLGRAQRSQLISGCRQLRIGL